MTYLFIFILSIVLSGPYVIDICSGYLNYQGFDLQQFLLWHYASINNAVPYVDIFYPYGMLSYFRNFNLIYAAAYYLVVPTLFTIIFFIFKKVFKDKLILYACFAIFYLFILILVGFQTFSRYGSLVVLSLYFSHLLYSSRKIKTNVLVFLGIILGLVCSFIIDQSIYLIFSFIFLYLLSRRFKINEILYVTLGFFLGTIPLLMHLLTVGNFEALLNYFNDVKEIVAVAKTPFFSFIDSPANMLTISILYIAIFYNSVKIFFFKRKLTLSSFLQISLIFSILIMEQKSIIRSIDRQITFVSLILLMFLTYETINYLKNKIINKRIIYFLVIFIVTTLYGLNINKQTTNLSELFRNYNLLVKSKCFDSNLNLFLAKKPSYVEIVDFLKKQKNFNGKIFSFPTGDSAFYVLLNQRPPFYNSIFEGASYEKQKYIIKYIQENEIEFVILNTNVSSLQDGVPDYIRQSLLFKHILNNYYPFAVVGNHLILKKDKDIDFFSSSLLDKVKVYKNYLLNVDLKKIPHSEGLYKYDFLRSNNKLLIKSSVVDKINSFLEESDFYSTNMVLAIEGESSYIKLLMKNGEVSVVNYESCKASAKCIINLSNIPIFYKEKQIIKVILDDRFEGSMEIYDLKNSGNLW